MKQTKVQCNTCGQEWDVVRTAICSAYFHNAARIKVRFRLHWRSRPLLLPRAAANSARPRMCAEHRGVPELPHGHAVPPAS
eukprot:scaffold3998_cov323-Prasinococcus_capsulatus_cf.AAC.1